MKTTSNRPHLDDKRHSAVWFDPALIAFLVLAVLDLVLIWGAS